MIHRRRALGPVVLAVATCLALACQTAREGGGIDARRTSQMPPTPGRWAESTRLEMVWPKRLLPGDTIAFVAPAGELDRERMALARQRLEQRGYKVVQRDDLFASEGYLAGSDERRAEELMRAFLDPEVDAIFPGTGGYGTMRILDRLDYRAIRQHPKLLIGFSDITGLHAALNRRAGLITWHSPNPMWGMGNPDGMTPFSERWFFRAVEASSAEGSSGDDSYAIEQETPLPEGSSPIVGWGGGKARGRLVGGNLSLISALEGTPYAIDTRGAILVIEDVREAPYRVDRMLRQLELAGKLAVLRGAVLAQFTRNYDREDEQRREDPRFTVDGVLRQYFAERGIPVLSNFPLGHAERNATLPLGGLVEIDADRATLTVLDGEPTPWLEAPGHGVAAARWSRDAAEVHPGLVRATMRAGHPSLEQRFQVSIGEFELQPEADAALASLEAAGFAARVGYLGGATGSYGVFLPDFADRASAEAARRRLAASAFPKASLREVGQDLSSPSGPWVVSVLEVDPSRFRVDVMHAGDAAIGVETTRATARRHGAAAAINGGYYVTRGVTRGDSAGYLRIDGDFLSEPDRRRASVGLLDEAGRTEALFGRLTVGTSVRLADGDELSVDGINRARGDREAIVYTPEFHRTTLTDPSGTEVVVALDTVVDVRAGQGSSRVPAQGWVLSLGPGRAVREGAMFHVGDRVGWEVATTADEPEVRWQHAADVVSGGPLLLRGGRRVTDWATEPFARAFCEARHPRTALGVKADGTLLLITVDGRRPDWSVGMSLPELTDLLLELGAVDAINLDGGGSTTMVVGDQVVNRPSDPSGERENGDAILVIAR